jgi:excisionase family DNA binding protein
MAKSSAVLTLPAPPEPGAQLTIQDVVKQLRTNRRTVAQLMQSGQLRYLRMGRVYRFRQEWIDAFIDGAARARRK